LCPGRHPDLVTHAVIADRSPRGVGTVKEIIAWERRIVTTRIPDAVVNGVVPIVIVIGRHSVPATIMRHKSVMRPPHAGVGAGHNNVLPGEPKCPDLGRMRVIDPRFDCGRGLTSRTRLFHRARLRQVIMNLGIAFYSCHVRAGR